MKRSFTLLRNRELWKKCAVDALSVIGIVSSVITVIGFSLGDYYNETNWVERLKMVFIFYAIILFLWVFIKIYSLNKGITLNIRGITVVIKEGNIFDAIGWKIIPFTENFDTKVDGKIVARDTLNGIFIEDVVGNDALEELIDAIEKADEISTIFKRYEKNGRTKYPLGRIITFRDYMLLSFSHQNEGNIAFLTLLEYEQCLMAMWKEISRNYANIPVFIPLLGSGVTRFTDVPEKSNGILLRCILHTLQISREHINQPVTILLTSEALSKIKIYEMRGMI